MDWLRTPAAATGLLAAATAAATGLLAAATAAATGILATTAAAGTLTTATATTGILTAAATGLLAATAATTPLTGFLLTFVLDLGIVAHDSPSPFNAEQGQEASRSVKLRQINGLRGLGGIV
jgi:hypothetical protein